MTKSHIGQFACYQTGDIVCGKISKLGTWEVDATNALRPFMGPSTVFVDVGSNVGWYTFTMARTHDVVAYEPFEKNLKLQAVTRCLQPALARRIELHGHGLSNKNQTCDLYQVLGVNEGDTHSVCDETKRKAMLMDRTYHYQKLGTASLRLLDDVASPSLFAAEKVMKVDIEGHEYEMLRGADRFLSQGSPPKALFVEVFQLAAKKPLLDQFLLAKGYSARPVGGGQNVLYVRAGEHARRGVQNQQQHADAPVRPHIRGPHF